MDFFFFHFVCFFLRIWKFTLDYLKQRYLPTHMATDIMAISSHFKCHLARFFIVLTCVLSVLTCLCSFTNYLKMIYYIKMQESDWIGPRRLLSCSGFLYLSSFCNTTPASEPEKGKTVTGKNREKKLDQHISQI